MNGQAGKQMAIWMRDKLKSLGFPKLMRIEIAGETAVLVSDVDYVNSAILPRMSDFARDGKDKQFLLPVMGNDEQAKLFLLTRNMTPYVKAVRKIYATAMQASQLRKAIPKLNTVMHRMFDVIESKSQEGSVDIQKLCVQFTLDTIGVVALDTNLGGLDGSREIQKKLIAAGYEARAMIARPFHVLYCKLFPSSAAAQQKAKTINALTEEWDALAREIIEKEAPPEGEMPIWYALKSLVDPETGRLLAFESLRAELATLVVAGMDSTGHQLGWILAMLASHPHIADKLLEELRDHGLYGNNAKDITFEDLGELKYLAAVIKEGTRIAHIGMLTNARVAAKDVEMLGHRLPKGTIIFVPSNRSMCSEADWGDPGVVRPERWLTDEDLSHKSFKIFSAGPRDCVGQKLAMLELRFATVKLITRYKLSLDVPFNALLENTVDGLVIEAKDGIWVKVSPGQGSEKQTT